MTFYVESETDRELPFDAEEVAGRVIVEALDSEQCPYEVSLNVLLTDNEGIQELNKQYRGIDRPTDVLSFPNVDYDNPSLLYTSPSPRDRTISRMPSSA